MNINEYLRRVDTDSEERQRVYEYYRCQPPLDALSDEQAAMQFEALMHNPGQKRAMLNAYLLNHTPPPTSTNSSSHPVRQLTEQGKHNIRNAVIATGAGILGLVLASTIDDETARRVVELTSSAATLGGIVGAGYTLLMCRK